MRAADRLPATGRRFAARRRAALLVLLAALGSTALIVTADDETGGGDWTQWGGPSRDFSAPGGGATGWSEEGPRKLWSRPLGEGYSAILYETGRLYTMFRANDQEVVVSLDAETGATVWEYRYPAPPPRQPQYGSGPQSTPAIAGDLLFTVGIAGRLQALKKGDGSPLWSRELWGEAFGGSRRMHGYASSPLVHERVVIVPVGGDLAGLVAFDQETGEIEWRSPGFENSYSSPRIVELAGERQLLVFTAKELIGVDPSAGRQRWSYPHRNQWGTNVSMPVVAGDMVFLSSPQAGARGLRLSRDGDSIRVEEAWATRRIQLYHVSSVRIGDWIYGSSGVTTPAFMTAVNIHTGEIAWRERGFAKANCVEVDGRLVILDEDGVLYLATATPEGIEVLARTQLLDRVAWTVPTIVGSTLYARDRRRILAVRLG